MSQLGLFGEPEPREIVRLGATTIEYAKGKSILAKASGFMGDYDYTLNPYSGCSFGCAYCYAAFFIASPQLREEWGRWVTVKEDAVAKIRAKKDESLQGKSIYMSSVTDPYQPIERKLGLTRDILEELARPERQPRLVVQTRSPLVTRDIDLFQRFEKLRISMTISTDDDAIRKAFEPGCPSIERRFQALEEIRAAGLKLTVCVTPMLPVTNMEAFADRILSLEPAWAVAQPFKGSQGPFAASTRDMARRISQEYGWTQERYEQALTQLRRRIPDLREGRDGFPPE